MYSLSSVVSRPFKSVEPAGSFFHDVSHVFLKSHSLVISYSFKVDWNSFFAQLLSYISWMEVFFCKLEAVIEGCCSLFLFGSASVYICGSRSKSFFKSTCRYVLLIPATFHITMSSAYSTSSDFKTLGRSFIKIKNMEQVEDEPCGSPSAKILYADKASSLWYKLFYC